MTIEQFGQEIKKKYPQYQDVPDAELGQRVIDKYPVYQRVLSPTQPASKSPADIYDKGEKPDGIVASITKPLRQLGAQAGAAVSGVGSLLGSAVRGDTSEEAAQKLQSTLSKKRFGETAIGADPTSSLGKDIGKIIGTGTEIASFAAPIGIAGKGVSTAAKVGAKAVKPTLTALAKGGVASGALGQTGRELQEGKPLPGAIGRIAGASLAGGATGFGLPVIGRGLSAVGRLGRSAVAEPVKRLGTEVLGRTTGAGAEAIQQVWDNPNVLKYARQAGKEGPNALMDQALSDAKRGLSLLRKSRGTAYVKELNKIKLDKRSLDDIVQQTRNAARSLLEDNNIKIGSGKALNNLDFGASTIERGQGTVQKAFNDVMKWTDNTPAGLDRLKKKLSQHLDEIPVTERGGAFSFVRELHDSVSSALKQQVPGYEGMTKSYSEASDLIDEIQRALSLKDTAMKDTTIRKLMSSMRQNNELRKEMLDVLGKVSGKDITAKIAGATLGSMTPRGLAGALQPTATGLGGLQAFINPSSIPFLLVYLATSSPRLMAEAITLLSKAKGPTIPPATKRALARLLIQASRQPLNKDGNNQPQ